MTKFVLATVLALCFAGTADAATWYVDKDNKSDTQDGTSWQTAFTTIQPAIDAAYNSAGGQVWVAQGTYNEQRTSYPHDGGKANINTGSIMMLEGVHIYGGFVGDETSQEDRDWELHETIIDGSTARDGEPAYHVVIGADNSTLDGLTVTGGKANETSWDRDDGDGGGIYNYEASPTLSNCTFVRNSATDYGGGMSNKNSSPTVTNCLITDNSARDYGSGISNSDSSPTFVNCIFAHNTSSYRGGGIYNSSSSPTFLNCTITDNFAVLGGGISNSDSSPTLVNCIIWENEGGEIPYSYESLPVVGYSNIQGGHEGEGNIDSDPLLVDSEYGDYRLQANSPCIDAGTLDGAPDTDFWAIPRPQGALVDMGAFEFPSPEYDADGDTIPDIVEGEDDHDHDGLVNSMDDDSDDDGMSDFFEGIGDMDQDGLPNYIDDDSDGDGISDSIEGDQDTDGDGRINSLDLDSDGDGYWDTYEGTQDSDSDGIPNYIDMDSDGDGIPDKDEPVIVYVNAANTGGVEDGASWDTAFTTLQPAIDEQSHTGNTEVWVLAGTYAERRTSYPHDDGANTASMIMRVGVHIYGGFVGDETSKNQRDWQLNPTIIDGSTSREGEAAYHVVVGAYDSTLDGFKITGGNGTEGYQGGGMYNKLSAITVANCTITGNSASSGGGVSNVLSSATFTKCTFTDNVSIGTGGAVYSRSSSLTFTNCAFDGNTSGRGGAVYDSYSSMTYTDSFFARNSVSDLGGGICSRNSSQSLTNCVFAGNTASVRGGAIYNSYSSPALVNCTITDNSAYSGGGIWNYDSSPTLVNCIVWENQGGEINHYSEIFRSFNGAVAVASYSNIKGGYEGEGNIDVNPLFFDIKGGDLRIAPDSPSVDSGTIDGAPDSDYWGVPRPQGDGIDMGAYEVPTIDHDVDGDTIPDIVEGDDDGDQDGLGNSVDADSDDDGIFDLNEGIGDMDQDGLPSYLDDDSDGDGILDSVEGADDADGDGRINLLDLDSDGDGFWDAYEGTQDSDSDGIPDYIDLDSDGDGVLDENEPVVIHVNLANTGGGEDGTSWATAFTTLQPAIDIRNHTGNTEVWVAGGTYGEQRTSYPHNDTTNTGSVIIYEDAHIYGGFAGHETLRDERDWKRNPTIIDGSTSRDGEAAYHVVIGSDNSTLDGFTITGGSGTYEYPGGGMYNDFSSPTLTNCTFIGNSSSSNAAGMYNNYCSPTLTNCTFTDNSAPGPERSQGGGMYNYWSSPTLTNCTFTDNTTNYSGGAVYSVNSSPTFTNCTFDGNVSARGGAVYNTASISTLISTSSATLTNCRFTNNSALATPGSRSGGGAIWNLRSYPTLLNCTFTGNLAALGGGIYNYESSPSLTDCTFSANSNSGMYNYMNSSPSLANCTFENNSADDGGSGMHNYWSSPTLINCIFFRNSAEADGGGIWNLGSSPTLANCTLTDNSAASGGGINNDDNSYPIVTNCILWGNEGGEIYNYTEAVRVVSYSNVQGGYDGEGNIDSDPIFVDPENGDFRLQADSPCIDTGTLDGAPDTDIRGTHRPVGDGVDMGAYEYTPASDVNFDGMVNAVDVQHVINAVLGLDSDYDCDINDDGKLDAADIQLTINAALDIN